MKTIIVATDYSKAADNALDYAAAFARCTASKIVLFNAFHLPIPASTPPFPVPDIHELMAMNKARLEKLASGLTHTYGILVECVSITGSFREELDEVVARFGAELVVMGMRTGSISRSLFGSTTTSVIRHGKYPILVVPDIARFQGIAKILFACDFKSLKGNNELSMLQELAQTFKARVQVFHVEQQEELVPAGKTPDAPKLERVLRGIKHTYRNLEEIEVVDGIEQGVQDYLADLLVMVPNKPDFLDRLLNLSNTRKIALQTHVPLLTLPNPC